MEEVLKSRLIEAATAMEGDPMFRLEIITMGVVVRYVWEGAGSPGTMYTTEKFISWVDMEVGGANPLMSAMTSVTKQAGVLG